MYSEHARTGLMYVDYGGDAYAGMGIKAMKSFARPRGMEPSERTVASRLFPFTRNFFLFFTRLYDFCSPISPLNFYDLFLYRVRVS